MSRWKFVALWQISGMICVLAVPAALFTIASMRQGLSFFDSLLRFPSSAVMIIFIVVLIAPLSILTLWAWTKLVARFPAFERSHTNAFLGLWLCALVLSFAAGVISHWEALVSDAMRRSFVRDMISTTISVSGWACLGVILPRWVVRSLRPPMAVTSATDAPA